MDRMINNQKEIEKTYYNVRNSVINAQNRIYTVVNSAMVQAVLGD